MCLGRTSSSKDPDKLGVSVAEIMRHNEPTLDRTLTRVAEASRGLLQVTGEASLKPFIDPYLTDQEDWFLQDPQDRIPCGCATCSDPEQESGVVYLGSDAVIVPRREWESALREKGYHTRTTDFLLKQDRARWEDDAENWRATWGSGTLPARDPQASG